MLTASTYGHEGRSNHRSNRTFTLEDETLRLAILNNQGRFVKDLKLDGVIGPPPYRTFATMPVSTENLLFGIITVDSPNPGDIENFEATELLNLFASQFALTFMANAKDTLHLKIGDQYTGSD